MHELAGFGVLVDTAEWPGGSQELRATCTIRTQNPNWDFSLQGRSFCGGQPAAAAGYRVRPGAVAASRTKQASGSGRGTTQADTGKDQDDFFDQYFDKSETPATESGKSSVPEAKHKPVSNNASVAKTQSDNDSLLGVRWPGDDKQQGADAPQAALSRAPRTEGEALEAIRSMGFQVYSPATFGAIQGYYIRIVNHAQAAQFGFKEIHNPRALDGKQSVTGLISFWTEQSGDQLILWIDQRDVSIPNGSKLPSFVRLFAR